jgi:hypothetical protein
MEDTNLAAMFATAAYPVYVLIDRDGNLPRRGLVYLAASNNNSDHSNEQIMQVGGDLIVRMMDWLGAKAFDGFAFKSAAINLTMSVSVSLMIDSDTLRRHRSICCNRNCARQFTSYQSFTRWHERTSFPALQIAPAAILILLR